MEDLDEKPSRFHELNNALHAALAGIGVTNARLEEQARQSVRIESAITAQTGRIDRFDLRMTEVEKNQIGIRGDLERKITDVRNNVHTELSQPIDELKREIAELKSQMALFSPVRLIVYGVVVMVLTAFCNIWVNSVMLKPH